MAPANGAADIDAVPVSATGTIGWLTGEGIWALVASWLSLSATGVATSMDALAPTKDESSVVCMAPTADPFVLWAGVMRDSSDAGTDALVFILNV